jgi:hypothetical protein
MKLKQRKIKQEEKYKQNGNGLKDLMLYLEHRIQENEIREEYPIETEKKNDQITKKWKFS